MNKVVTINLNGRAYQLEEAGFDALRAYLDEAASRLAADPGKSEILADLEQAIAEKCDKTLSSHKTVVNESEVRRIIAEMGPVDGSASSEEKQEHADGAQGTATPKRLYRIEEGAMIWGVCNGLAAFFGVDVALVRVIFVILAVVTGGGFCLVYGAMALIIPKADTIEKQAEARGEPFNAQELVNRVQQEYEKISAGLSASHAAHLKWKRERKQMRRQWKHARTYSYRAHRPNPIVGLIKGALSLTWILALISLITTGAIFGWMIPAGIPLWVSIIILFIVYQAVIGPMRGAAYAGDWGGEYFYSEWDGLGDGLTVLFLVIAFGWAYLHVPQFYAFVHHPIAGIKDAASAIKTWWQAR